MKATCMLLFTGLWWSAAAAQSPDVQLRAAQQKETVEGDLNGAIAIYRKLADDRATPAEVAARALVRLGRCYQRLGSTEARKAFERVLNQYSAQASAASEAKQLLAAMDRAARPTDGGLVVRKLQSGSRGTWASALTVTRDARYAVAVRGRSEIVVVNVITGEQTPVRTQEPITSGNESIYGTAISPDGQRIAFDVPTGMNSSELRLIDRSTGHVGILFKSDSAFRSPVMDWSGDGRTILVRAGLSDGLHLIDADSGAVRAVSGSGKDADIARLSPDGQYIAYMVRPARTAVSGRIFVERADGSDNQLIADADGGSKLAGWSSDGRFVLFSSNDLGAEHLWAMQIEGGRPKGVPLSLGKGLPRGTSLTMARNGSLIVSISGVQRCYIAAIDPSTGAGSLPKDVNALLNAQIFDAVWSPNGAHMVYSARRELPAEKPTDLFIRDEVTAEERKLGSFPLIPRKMSWTPDGKALIMPQFSNGGSAIVRYWLSDGRIEQLVPSREQEPVAKAHPKLAADGRTVFYLEGSASLTGSRLMRYDLMSGTGASIATVNHTYDVSPDGLQLVIPFVDAASKSAVLRIINRDGEPVRDLVRLKPNETISAICWSPDGRWIYFGKGTERDIEIDRVSVAGGDLVSTGLRTSGFPDIVVHPSGKQIVYLDQTGSELWRVDAIEEALAHMQ